MPNSSRKLLNPNMNFNYFGSWFIVKADLFRRVKKGVKSDPKLK